jgi:hypothetical protein
MDARRLVPLIPGLFLLPPLRHPFSRLNGELWTTVGEFAGTFAQRDLATLAAAALLLWLWTKSTGDRNR